MASCVVHVYLCSSVVLVKKKFVAHWKKKKSRIQPPSHPSALASLKHLVFCFWQSMPKVWTVRTPRGYWDTGRIQQHRTELQREVSMGAIGYSFSPSFHNTRTLAPPP